MEFTANHIESIYKKAKSYTETSIELFKLEAVDTTADLIASFITRFVLIAITTIFIFFMSIALSLYIGTLLNAAYLGFAVVSSFYMISGLAVYFFNLRLIKNPVSGLIIDKLLNKRKSNTSTNFDNKVKDLINEND